MLGAPESVLPHVQQTRSTSMVAELAAAPVAIAHVAPTTRSVAPAPTTRPVATVGSTGATVVTSSASKLSTVTTPAKIVRGPTSWTLLNQAIARIPNYRSGVATWVVTNRYGHWGATDLANGDIYISPNIPASKVYSVASHEYAHARTLYNYGWNLPAANVALNPWFGGGDVAARERAADCMAIAQGATWTNYTTCQNDHWRQGARILLAGKRLP
ncbi:MAG: hypothetical protein IMZ75_17255 [Actinobacteria bacterium]|nr:hypothetical protein [Actinomycetota bacterium]